MLYSTPLKSERRVRVPYKSFLSGTLLTALVFSILSAAQGTKAGQASRGPGKTPGETRLNPKDGLMYVWIPPGTFRMGCSPGDTQCRDRYPGHVSGPWEEPHTVTISKGFWMGQTLVTQDAYYRVTHKHRHDDPYPGKDMPIQEVDWEHANAYCTAVGTRLPTEAEWEYAARAGTTGARYGDLDAIAWYKNNSGGHPHPVKQKQRNAWGLYDMLGNLRQWTNDWYGENYFLHSPAVDPQGPPGPASSGPAPSRMLRGGSYLLDASSIRASERVMKNGDSNPGFRCAGNLL
jgi:formylglycine-generating enzyme required for sulfatase activity